jgi:predicted alpha/beta-fold hydrolase
MPSEQQRKQRLAALPPYRSPVWLKGGHAQTIWAKTRLPPAPPYRRQVLTDSTGQTAIPYDWIDSDCADAPLLVLFHGLEGSSHSHYARALMQAVAERGWQGCVAHFRGCGGIANTAPIAYHSGDSAEIGHYLATLRRLHPQRPLYAAGVSLGGNALAKYLGETGDAALCDAAAVISAPVDLPAASVALERGLSRRLYAPYFLHTLLPKVRAEAAQYPPFDLNAVLKSRSLGDFDNAFTAPVHGFADKNDYYRRAAAKPLLRHILKPTLLLNAQNDPFMPAAALPGIHDVSEQVYLHQPPQGGHVGFVSGSGRGHLRWLPETLLAFFEFETHPS